MFRDQAIRLVVNQPCRILNGIKAFDVDGNVIEYDENEVLAKLAELQAEYDALQYQRDRAVAYPSIQDVVVALAEKEEGNDAMWQEITAQRAKVKSDNPKP